MGSSGRTALVLGATGGIGGAVAVRLLRAGWSVRALVRDPDRARASWPVGSRQPEWVIGDAMNRAKVIGAGSGCEAVVHAVNPPGYRDWDRLAPPMLENTIAAAQTDGARIILPGTVYNYDPAAAPVVSSDTPQMPRSAKGRVRVRLERMLEEAAPETPSLIVRAGDFFGPGVRSSWFSQGLIGPERPVRRLLNPAKGPGHSWAYVPDLADAIVQLMESPGRLSPFERLQFAGYHDNTGEGMIRAVHAALGRTVPVRAFPWWAMRLLAPFGGFPREAAEIEPFWRLPMRFDNQRLVALIGPEPQTDLETAVSATLLELGALDR